MSTFIRPLLLATLLPLTGVTGYAVELMPLEEVKPGQIGEWRTVRKGSEVETFQLEVLGVAQHFVGPQRSVVICRALDAEKLVSGPVAGMSGSPVYIDGKLVGAYAYGFAWAKEQALIGVTPIADMLEVIGQEGPSTGPVVVQPGGDSISPEPTAQSSWSSAMRPLPAPLTVTGFSAQTLDAFAPQLDELGLHVTQAPMGGVSDDVPAELVPGSAVAGVIMTGDFNVAGTGTVTWTDGDDVLAFGHPFLGVGEIDIPMASAEIITIVQSYQQSFKLSNLGPIVGALTQDRLTAIAGEIGKVAPTTSVDIRTHNFDGTKRAFHGDVARHPRLSPLFSAIALFESLTQSLELEERQTFFVDTRIELADRPDIVLQDVATGPNGALDTALRFLDNYAALMNNPFKPVAVENVEFDIRIADQWFFSTLRSVRLVDPYVKVGGQAELELTLWNYQEQTVRVPITVPIPRSVRPGQTLAIMIAAAGRMDEMDHGRSRAASSVDELIDEIAAARSRQAIYVRLLQRGNGVRIEGQNIDDLPPSVKELLDSPASHYAIERSELATLWEGHVELPGEYSGQYYLPIRVER